MTISIPDLEHAAARSWRALEEERLGDWLLRAADGFTGRANSALATGDPGLPLTEAIETVHRWYDARSRPAMIAMAYPTGQPAGCELDQILDDLGWTVRADAATVMTASAAAVAGFAGGCHAPVTITRGPDAAWVGLTAIEVDQRHRRKRLGTIVTTALAAHAADRGATELYLQVTDHNAAAMSLYRRLGFTDHHGYHYRVLARIP